MFFHQSCTDSLAQSPLPKGCYSFMFFDLVLFTITFLLSFWFSPQYGCHKIHSMKDFIRDWPNMGLPIIISWYLVTETPSEQTVEILEGWFLVVSAVNVPQTSIHCDISVVFNESYLLNCMTICRHFKNYNSNSSKCGCQECIEFIADIGNPI